MLFFGDLERMEKIIWLSKYKKFEISGNHYIIKYGVNQEKVSKKCAEVVLKKEL